MEEFVRLLQRQITLENPDIDGEPSDADSQTTGIYLNLAFGVPITLVCLLLFEPLRRRIPSVFEARRKLNLAGEPLDYEGNRVYAPPAPSYKLFGWFLPTLRLDLDTIADTHGLDAAMFLRYQRFMLALFCAMLLPTAVLLPVFYTGNMEDVAENVEDIPVGINKLSISNVATSDPWRFWLVLFVEYFITAFVLYHIYRQFKFYSKYRRRYRASPHPANYAIIVQDIPTKQCTEEAIHEYWNHIFPGEVAAVFHVQDARQLEKDKQKFWKAVTERERAELKQYNRTLRRRRKCEKLQQKNKPIPKKYRHLEDSDHDQDPSATCFGICVPRKPRRAIAYWREKQTLSYAKVMAHQIRRKEGTMPPTQSAVVVFNTRRAASIAAQVNFARREDEWRVQRAPEPEAINWGVLAVGGRTIYLRQFVTTLLCTAFTIFWVIPVTAIMSLVSISSLAELTINGSKPLQWLEGIKDLSSVITGFLESNLPTLVLIVFLSIVPNIFEFFVSISRIVSQAQQARLVRDWYFIFVVVSNFFFVAFSGTLLKEIAKIIDQPSQTVDILARNVPKQAAFMMNFILLTALTETPRELLQIFRVGGRWFKLTFIAKTERQREEADVGDMTMDYVGFYATGQLVTLLGLIYSTIQPLIIVCCIAYFAVSYVVFKYNVCYALYNDYQDGGRMFGGAIYAVWVGLIMHLLTMIGVLGLNKSPEQSVMIIIPTVVSVLFLLHCRKSFDRVIEHGSALETQDKLEDLENRAGIDSISEERTEMYEHPGFEELPTLEELENKSGVPGKSDETTEQESAIDSSFGKIPSGESGLDEQVEERHGVRFEDLERGLGGDLDTDDTGSGDGDDFGSAHDETEGARQVEDNVVETGDDVDNGDVENLKVDVTDGEETAQAKSENRQE